MFERGTASSLHCRESDNAILRSIIWRRVLIGWVSTDFFLENLDPSPTDRSSGTDGLLLSDDPHLPCLGRHHRMPSRHSPKTDVSTDSPGSDEPRTPWLTPINSSRP